MFARFDENPAMTLRVIKETKRYGRADAHTDGRMDVKTVYPLQTKFAGGIKKCKMRISILISIYTIHFAYLKVNTKFEEKNGYNRS